MISRAPDWWMPQQQGQHMFHPVWQHIVMVRCLYSGSTSQVNVTSEIQARSKTNGKPAEKKTSTAKR